MSGTEVAKPRRRSPYNAFEIEQGLQAVALCAGNTRAAERHLEKQGVKIPFSTLRDWSLHTKRAEYERIRDEVAPKLFAKIGEQNLRVAEKATELEVKFLEEIEQKLDSGQFDAKDLPGALRNVAVTKGVAVDKASVISGRPTEIRSSESLQEVFRKLDRKYGKYVKIDKALLGAKEVQAEEVEVKEEE